jgi:hypothetical protein
MTYIDAATIATGGVESALLILMGILSYKLYKMSMKSNCHTKCCDMTFKMPEGEESQSPAQGP